MKWHRKYLHSFLVWATISFLSGQDPFAIDSSLSSSLPQNIANSIELADVNNDGLEDLYLCQEPGIPNKLFIQMGNGTLKDYSAKFGVNWLEDSRSSLIIDLDNDGYRDLVIAMYGYVLIAKNRGVNDGFQVIDIIPTNESNTSVSYTHLRAHET